jgi:hypothetical protein
MVMITMGPRITSLIAFLRYTTLSERSPVLAFTLRKTGSALPMESRADRGASRAKLMKLQARAREMCRPSSRGGHVSVTIERAMPPGRNRRLLQAAEKSNYFGGRCWDRTSDPCRVKACRHPFWVKCLDDNTRENNHIGFRPITRDHLEFRSHCGKTVARDPHAEVNEKTTTPLVSI